MADDPRCGLAVVGLLEVAAVPEVVVGKKSDSDTAQEALEAISLQIGIDEAVDAALELDPDARPQIVYQLARIYDAVGDVEQGVVSERQLQLLFQTVDRIRHTVDIAPAQRYRFRRPIR